MLQLVMKLDGVCAATTGAKSNSVHIYLYFMRSDVSDYGPHFDPDPVEPYLSAGLLGM